MAGSLFPARSPAFAFPREDCEVGIGVGRPAQRTGPWRPREPGLQRGTGRRGGCDLQVLLAAQGTYLLLVTWDQLGLLLFSDLKGNYNCVLVHSIKALRSPAAT